MSNKDYLLCFHLYVSEWLAEAFSSLMAMSDNDYLVSFYPDLSRSIPVSLSVPFIPLTLIAAGITPRLSALGSVLSLGLP